jgi:hypothetical protein
LTSYNVYNERRNYTSSPFTVVRNKLTPLEGDINIEGSRAVDNAKFIVASPVDVRIGDIVSCIADDVDSSELIGAWNFYHNLRDESSYNLDGVDSSNNIVYARNTEESSRFRGHPYIDFNASNPTITITPSTTENNSTIINFDHENTIVLWCRPRTIQSGQSEIIFDRSDSGNGLKIGVQNSGGTYSAFIQVKGSGGSWVTSTINSNVQFTASQDLMISVEKYGSATQYRISINGSNLWNYAVYSGNIEDSSPPPIRLGLSSAGGNSFEGRLYSLRMYTNILSSSDHETLFKRKQPFSTMKFSGKVTKVTDGNSATTIEAAGFSSELLIKTEMTADLGSNLTSNGKYTDTLLEDIVANVIAAVNSDVLDTDDIKYEFVYDNVNDEDDDRSSDWKKTENQFHMRRLRKLVSSGKLHSLVQILAVLGGKEYNTASPPTLIHNNGADSFFMLPRKVLIFESSMIDSNTHFTVDRSDVAITDGGYSSANIWNDVSIFGKAQVKVKTASISGSNVTFNAYQHVNNPLSGNKKIWRIGAIHALMNSGQTYYSTLPQNSLKPSNPFYDAYTVDADGGFDYFIITAHNFISDLVWQYEYVDLDNEAAALTSSTVPTEDKQTYYYQRQNDASIEKYGKKSKKFYYPMLEDMTTTAAVCRRILGSNAEKQKKVQIIIPHLSNSIQIGSKVTVTNTLKKINNEELTVKSINYKFPNFRTTVNIGDYSYDFLDNMSQVFDTVNLQESERTGIKDV